MASPVSPLKLLFALLYLLLWPTMLLWLGGDWRWREGWIFDIWFVVMCTSTMAWLYVKNPALLAERYRKPGSGGQSRRDQIIVYLLGVGFMGWIALMPLDARRFHWTPRLPLPVELAGGLLLLVAWLFLMRAFTDNSFLSPLVRIQDERQQRVVSTGVYAIVRHPMYAGGLLYLGAMPLALGSWRALIALVAIAPFLIWRLIDEERFLGENLPGYAQYCAKVRWRLFPGVF
jgi:protein-S-isoprenylcysteine O-methyltransferase Ste14